MKKERIVIASVLKPVDDTRMFEKMALTLEASGAYEIFIIGYPSQRHPTHPSITFLPLGNFKRLSLTRLLTPLKVLKIIRQVKPQQLIVNTHELLIVACLNRIFFGTHIYYDIRENYYRNLRFTEAFPPIVRHLLAVGVRIKEKLISGAFHGFFLAEKAYEKEMKFFGDRAVVVENKAVPLPSRQRQKEAGKINLLFTGTLSESTGVFEAISLAKKLHAVTNSVRLRIVGSCAKYETLKKIKAAIRDQDFVTLEGGNRLVPHDEIIDRIFASDFGIVRYPNSPHTENSIPTKLYEYLTYRLPILVQNKAEWTNLCAPFGACIGVDFENIDSHGLLDKMQSESFYTSEPTDVSWENEGQKLLDTLQKFRV